MLRVQLFGSFHVEVDGKPVPGLESGRLQTFLAYLILHQGDALERRRLAFIFWPDSSESQARTNLRKILHALRQALPDADSFLEVTPNSIQWKADSSVRVDVFEFKRALESPASTDELRRAVDLYTGDLLPGAYDDWLALEREKLRDLNLDGLEKLVSALEVEGKLRSAVVYARRMLRFDPLRERAYRQLMDLYRQLGDRASAVSVYHTCVEVLRKELGVDVSPETKAAFEEVRRQEAAAAPRGATGEPSRRHNLPLQLSSFIGRRRELDSIRARLEKSRLVTLTGAGGSGKTRLAIQSALELEPEVKDGVWWVDLSEVSEPSLVDDAVAGSLRVREQSGRALEEALEEHVRIRELLLLLDNCEHVLQGVAELAARLLRAGPELRILATSRERLNLPGEAVYPIAPLGVPSQDQTDLTSIAQSEAVALFVERAAEILPTFRLTPENAAAVAGICRALDGIPLAIELAAARVRLLTPLEILDRLDDALKVLTGGSPAAPERHRTLAAAMDWSHEHLTPQERNLFRRLSVFSSSWTLAAAEAIGGVPLRDGMETSAEVFAEPGLPADTVLGVVSRLIDQSLVLAVDHEHETRYSMLEPVRQYAGSKLVESGEVEKARHRHFDYFLERADQASKELSGERQFAWMRDLAIEHADLRAALNWSLANAADEEALRMLIAIQEIWDLSGHSGEGIEASERVLERVDPEPNANLRTHAQVGLARLLYGHGDYARAEALTEESKEAFERDDDWAGVGKSLRILGRLAWRQSDFGRATQALEESIKAAGGSDDPVAVADAVHILGHVLLDQGEHQAARSNFERSLQLFKDIGDRLQVATLSGDLGLAAYLEHDYPTARRYFESNLEIYRVAGFKEGIARTLNRLGDLARSEGEYLQAEQLYLESLKLAQDLNYQVGFISSLHNLAYVSLHKGKPQLARERFLQSHEIARVMDDKKGVAEALTGLAAVAVFEGHADTGVRLFAAASSMRQSLGVELWPANQQQVDRYLDVSRKTLDEKAFAQAWAEGRELDEEAAIKLAAQSA